MSAMDTNFPAGAKAPSEAIGTVKGPGETPHEFTFIAPDPDRKVPHGEFVYYSTLADGVERRILGRVTGRKAVKIFPDTFMADPMVPPGQMAALLGYDSSATELFELTVTVLGYYDQVMKEFINPRVPPAGGAPIFIAENEYLAATLSRTERGAMGSAHLGSLLSRAPDAVPIALDVRGFTSTHLAILASTGSGKSYLAGVLLEELMMPHNRAAVLVVDPHGEYNTLQEMANHREFADGAYKPTVRIFRPNDVKVRFDTLDLGDLRYLLSNMSDKQYFQLGRAWRMAQKDYKTGYTTEQFLHCVRLAADAKPHDLAEDQEDMTTVGLVWRINGLKNSKVFSDVENLELKELFKPGQCTVLQLNEVPQREQQVIAAVILRRAYQARVDTEKKIAGRGDPNFLNFPLFCLIEEAHNFAPANADAVSTEQLKIILSEGRKFGVSVGLISQRPGKVDSDVLSQCMTQCIMRITNPIDQEKIASSVESVGRELIRELPSLTKGQVIVSGASINTPVLVRVRQRITSHGGQDINAPEMWSTWFANDEARAEKRMGAVPVDNREWREDDDGEPLRLPPGGWPTRR
jgi:DNA helicase HerA-like ATPase